MQDELKQMLDLWAGEGHVEVDVHLSAGQTQVLTLWVNVDGICRLRIGGIDFDKFHASITKNLKVKRTNS